MLPVPELEHIKEHDPPTPRLIDARNASARSKKGTLVQGLTGEVRTITPRKSVVKKLTEFTDPVTRYGFTHHWAKVFTKSSSTATPRTVRQSSAERKEIE